MGARCLQKSSEAESLTSRKAKCPLTRCPFILDISAGERWLFWRSGHRTQTPMHPTLYVEASAFVYADAVIGGKAKAPKISTDDMVKQMRPGSSSLMAVDRVVMKQQIVTTHTWSQFTKKLHLRRCQYSSLLPYLYYRPYQCDPSPC